MKKKSIFAHRQNRADKTGFDSDTGISVREFKERQTPLEWMRGKLSSFSFNGEPIPKILVFSALLIFLSLFQTTVFARFKPFGAVPDLILPLVCAVAISEKEKWGAVFGIIAAFVIESLGGSTFTILPLLYMPVGYMCGILSVHYVRDSIATRAAICGATSLLRALFTLFTILSTVGGATVITALTKGVLPELACNLIVGLIPQYLAKICLRPLNKTREEKVQ